MEDTNQNIQEKTIEQIEIDFPTAGTICKFCGTPIDKKIDEIRRSVIATSKRYFDAVERNTHLPAEQQFFIASEKVLHNLEVYKNGGKFEHHFVHCGYCGNKKRYPFNELTGEIRGLLFKAPEVSQEIPKKSLKIRKKTLNLDKQKVQVDVPPQKTWVWEFGPPMFEKHGDNELHDIRRPHGDYNPDKD